ncbi:hypothetical protein ACFQXA_15390 [Nocardiopsis composta]
MRAVGPQDAGRTDWAHPNVVLAVDPERAVAPAVAWMPGHQGRPTGGRSPRRRSRTAIP